MESEDPPVTVIATATTKGTRAYNVDAAASCTASNLTTAVAVVDGIGNSARLADRTRLLAETAVLVGAQRGGMAGLLSAGQLVADPGIDGDQLNAVGVVAVAAPHRATVVSWVGDCRAYGWNGTELRLYTTDHTVGQQLRLNGVPVELAAEHNNWVRTTLARAVVATVYEAQIPPEDLVLLTSDGVHDRLTHDEMTKLVSQHHADPQALADALVAVVAEEEEGGYRDDATTIILSRA